MTDFQQHVGPFQLHSQTGRTPSTNRYQATDRRSGQPVTLHLLTPEAAQQPSLVEQFLSNGSQAIRLRHPGLVAVVDVGEAQGAVYVATQWVEGQPLAEHLRRANSVVNIEAATYILNALAAVLDYTHQQGFIHGHITLDQICITNNNEVLLDGFAQAVHMDWAAATVTAPKETATNPALFISPFMAPEQAKAGEAVDFRADIYSLGAVLYAMLLGRPPFVGETTQQLLHAIVEEAPLPPEAINSTLPPAMIYVLKLVLAKDPAVRYASAGEFANAFQQSTQWRSAPPVAERTVVNRRRGLTPFVLLPLIAILCLLLLTGAGLGWFGQRFAFLSATTGDSLVTQLRGLLGSDPAVAQLTAQPAMLTPVVMVTVIPSTPTSANLTATVAVAQMVNETQSATTTQSITTAVPLPTTTITALASPTNTFVIATATTTGAIATNRATPTASTPTASTPTASTNEGANSTTTAVSPIIIDPVGLLTGPVAAGKLIINGIAEPGAAVQVQINGETIGNTKTKVSGTWSMIVDLSQPGAYDITAEVLDQNGNVVAAAQQPVTIVAAENTAAIGASAAETVTATLPVTPITTTPFTATATLTPTGTNSPTATHTPQPTATTTNTMQPTATNTPAPTATQTLTPTATATLEPTTTATHTPRPTATATHTPRPTATNTATVPATVTNTPLPSTLMATHTNTVLPTATPILQPTETPTVEATATPAPTVTNTPTPVPTATHTNTALPTATNTPRPTATKTAMPAPTATHTNTVVPTATYTNTSTPVPTATNTPRPTATKTATPAPTATHTNTVVPTATASKTSTPAPTATNTPRPTATKTATPVPAATNTPRPTATNTPRPTATNTQRPTATNTPIPTATNTPLPTATNTPVPPTNTPRPTNTPAPTATNTPVPTPTAASGSIAPVAPGDGNSGQGQQTFSWTANFTPSAGYAFELVFWKAGEDPLRQSFGLAAPTTNLNVTLDLPRLDEQLGGTFDTGEYNWGVLLVRTTPTYERLQYLGGGYRFTYYRGGGDSGSGGQSSGE